MANGANFLTGCISDKKSKAIFSLFDIDGGHGCKKTCNYVRTMILEVCIVLHFSLRVTIVFFMPKMSTTKKELLAETPRYEPEPVHEK